MKTVVINILNTKIKQYNILINIPTGYFAFQIYINHTRDFVGITSTLED